MRKSKKYLFFLPPHINQNIRKVNEMAYNFDNLTNIIYANIGKRISKQKKRLGKTRDDIYSDVELLSNIMNNHRIRNRNPYLLTNAATQNIVKNLNFSSTYQLIWGKDDDLDLILRKTFFYWSRLC